MTKAIIVVDVQNGFVDGSTKNIPFKIQRLLSLVDFDHRIFTKFINIPGGQYETLLNWSKLQSSPATDIHEALIGLETITIEKNFYSCVTKLFRAYVNELPRPILQKGRGFLQANACQAGSRPVTLA